MRICRETSLDIRFAEHPAALERGSCAFPASGEDGSGQRPGAGSRDASLAGSQGSALSPRRAPVRYTFFLHKIEVFCIIYISFLFLTSKKNKG